MQISKNMWSMKGKWQLIETDPKTLQKLEIEEKHLRIIYILNYKYSKHIFFQLS